MCGQCGEGVECTAADQPHSCRRCGGELAGPVAPAPVSKRERCELLASPLYLVAYAGGRGPLPSAW
jgi:hypothetical protein